MEINQVIAGGAFRTTFVSSGATASPIQFQLKSGSETIVGTWAGVDSGNGLYYADVSIDTPGLWRGDWYATVAANTYHLPSYFVAFAGDTDQPGRYTTYDDIVLRYPTFSKIGDAVIAASHYICYAEAEVDARLGVRYATPFDRSNLTVRDLAIDIAYLRSLAGKSELYDQIKKSIDDRIGALCSGTMIMITSGGLVQDALSGAWSNTQNYHPIAAVALDFEDLSVDSGQFIDEALERGMTVGG